MTLYQYFGSGSLGTLSALSESKTYTYNISSIFNNLEDYQSITTSPDFTDDFGEIGQVSGLTVDYNLITDIVSGNAQPFGGPTLSGSANTEWVNKNFYGSGEYKVVYSPDNTSGTLFSFGEKIESRTYDYNESSVENTTVDYGLIDNPTIFIEDYQSIVDVSGITEDFNLITDVVSGNIQPFGGLTLSGSALTEPNYRLFFSGQAIVKTSYIPEITYGTLFGFGEKLESITYDYNSSSISENSLDYGLITSPQLGGPDYGFIAESSGTQPDENYGLIIETVQTEVSTPFGLSLFSGSAITSEIATYTKVASGTLTISGSALEAYSAQTPEDLILYQFNGNLQESRTYGYDGSGVVATISSQAGLKFLPGILGVGLFKFTTHLSDNLYDTCDSNVLTSDYQDSALVRFTANLLGSTQLFNVLGSANTQEINVYTQVGIGNVTLSGSLVERQTDSYLGTGTLYALSAGGKIEVDSYNGTGSLFGISGSSQSKSTQTPENALLITVSGTALTKLESEYSYSGISSVYVSGSASTRFEADYPYSGIGTITLSGQVVYPDIQFIPAPKGSGLFTFSGTSPNNTSRIGVLSGNKTLFAFSGGFESFSKVTYIGLGTVYIESTVGVAINNPFQIPRTYVVII